MADDDTKKGRAALEEIDLRLDGLLGKLGSSLGDLLEKLETNETAELHRTHEFPTKRGPLRAETGIRMRIGGLDAASRRGPEPVNPRPDAGAQPEAPPAPRAEAPAEAAQSAARTAASDTHVSGGRWVLTAELPGVTLPELSIAVEDRALRVETTGARRFRVAADLPEEADASDIETVMRNGILEISVALTGGAS